MNKDLEKKTKDFHVSRDEMKFKEYFAKIDPEFRRLLNERKFTASEIDISYRVLSHWDQIGILPDGTKTNGWRKFSIVEMVWLSAIKTLRGFGIPLNKTLTIKDSIFLWDQKKDSYPLLEFYVYKAWYTDEDPYIVILESGKADLGTSEELELTKFWQRTNDMLLISLKSTLKKLGKDVTLPKLILPSEEREEELLDLVRSSKSPLDLKKITGLSGERLRYLEEVFEIDSKITGDVRVKARNGKIKELETTEIYPTKPPLRKIEKSLKEKNGKSELIVKSTNGSVESAKVIKTERF
jgi:hypothetical protein